MQEKEIIQRIYTLCEARNWTVYRLAKESGITYSTLCTMLHKSNAPSLPTLTKICKGFGITLGQFFDDSPPPLTPEQAALLDRWERLSEPDRRTVLQYMDFLLSAAQTT